MMSLEVGPRPVISFRWKALTILWMIFLIVYECVFNRTQQFIPRVITAL